jgi:hypothetical protein
VCRRSSDDWRATRQRPDLATGIPTDRKKTRAVLAVEFFDGGASARRVALSENLLEIAQQQRFDDIGHDRAPVPKRGAGPRARALALIRRSDEPSRAAVRPSRNVSGSAVRDRDPYCIGAPDRKQSIPRALRPSTLRPSTVGTAACDRDQIPSTGCPAIGLGSPWMRVYDAQARPSHFGSSIAQRRVRAAVDHRPSQNVSWSAVRKRGPPLCDFFQENFSARPLIYSWPSSRVVRALAQHQSTEIQTTQEKIPQGIVGPKHNKPIHGGVFYGREERTITTQPQLPPFGGVL